MAKKNARRVYFKLAAPEAQKVHLCGSFNEWETESRELKRNKKGEWTGYLRLEPGTYEYRFVVDGQQWHNSPDAELVPNPYGTQNILLNVD